MQTLYSSEMLREKNKQLKDPIQQLAQPHLREIILKKYLDTSQLPTESSAPAGINLLQYAGVSKIDYGLLKNYLTTLEGISIPSFSRPEQRAFWINLTMLQSLV